MRKEYRDRLEKMGIKVRLMTPEEAESSGTLMYSVPKAVGLKSDGHANLEEVKNQDKQPVEES